MEASNSPWMCVSEVAAHLGVSVQFVYALVHQGKLKAIHITATWRILRTALEELIASSAYTPEAKNVAGPDVSKPAGKRKRGRPKRPPTGAAVDPKFKHLPPRS